LLNFSIEKTGRDLQVTLKGLSCIRSKVMPQAHGPCGPRQERERLGEPEREREIERERERERERTGFYYIGINVI
jgi:hypothetical protein